MKNICIIGSGSWGCALAIHAAKQGHNVKIWSFDQEEANIINNQKKCKFLPMATIPENVYCTTNIKEAVEQTDIILHVTPSKFFRDTLKKYKEYITSQPLIICSKGFEYSTLSTLSQVAKEEVPNVKIGAFSGPSHAEEVCLEVPTAMVIASKYCDVQYLIQDTFMNEKMRIYTSNDIEGVELGGALKNIIAFCAGIMAELNLGDNTFAALISRGLTEISRLGVAMGADYNTFYGLSGLGDLIVTCLSEHSRNRKAGRCIGKGLSIEETKKEVGMTIESFENIEIAYKLSKKYNIEMPIVNTVYEVLNNKLTPKEAVNKLMTREKKSE
ncbi:MAG: NAD(P)H-dependent glycerol-3-phosphate dehydrogenase [Clostridia bacterium]